MLNVRGHQKQPEKFPGFRQIMQIPNGTNAPIKAVVSWQIVLLPYLEKTDVYSAIQSGGGRIANVGESAAIHRHHGLPER